MSDVIVAGVDGSETAAEAADKAARLAAALQAELQLVCAYERFEVEHVPGVQEAAFTTEQRAQGVADKAAEPLRLAYPGLTITAVTEKGKPADALVQAAERVGATLIVVGNKRVQGAARILGSIATDVARKAPCDVYVAHTH